MGWRFMRENGSQSRGLREAVSSGESRHLEQDGKGDTQRRG